MIGRDHIFNFYTDASNPRGLLRKCPVSSFLLQSPSSPLLTWETVLDIDALNKSKSTSYVYKGNRSCPSSIDPTLSNREDGIVTNTLMMLSHGGGDACELLEFDLKHNCFVEDLPASEAYAPFKLHTSKSRCSYKSRDVLFVAYADAKDESTTTDSGCKM